MSAAAPPLPDLFDVIVVGAGHAGVEAALAASRCGAQVALLTLRLAGVAQMSCNPAIGGVGKGHLVREIDALGGAMGQVADATALQARRLNLSRGPAVRSTRVQSDALLYKDSMRQRLLDDPRIHLLVDEVVDLCTAPAARPGAPPRVCGVVGRRLGTLRGGSVVITTGTFLAAVLHTGAERQAGGRAGDGAAHDLAAALRRLGLRLERFKTGTTPRLEASSIDWDACEAQHGDRPPPCFSFDPPAQRLPERLCYLTHTTAQTHAIVRQHLHQSARVAGQMRGTGPRYCPSLEDKITRFAHRPSHLIFLEPESLSSSRIYPNGLSTSLPLAAQEAFIRSIPGLSRARIVQPGYAVAYDYAPPTQLQPNLMAKAVAGLFLAGQINGTSGYEEAAAQGLWAGLNAARFVSGAAPAVLGRSQAYLGVLIDDLVTRGVDEPYRMAPSRAEYRLTLREGTAEARLCPLAQSLGLIDTARASAAARRADQRQALLIWLRACPARAMGLPVPDGVQTLACLLRRPIWQLEDILQRCASAAGAAAAAARAALQTPRDSRDEVEDTLRYAGYVAREARDIARLAGMEALRLPAGLDYAGCPGLSNELREKLSAVRPTTLGQASRICGMTPAGLQRVHALLGQRSAAAASAPVPAAV